MSYILGSKGINGGLVKWTPYGFVISRGTIFGQGSDLRCNKPSELQLIFSKICTFSSDTDPGLSYVHGFEKLRGIILD